MKQFLNHNRLATWLAATLTAAAVMVSVSGPLGRTASATGADDHVNTQVAELHALQAAFHQAASYGGNIDLLMQLFSEQSTLTAGTTTYTGKAEIAEWAVTKWGPFLHRWVPLSPVFNSQFDVEGDTATFYFECRYADPSVTPYVIPANGAAHGTAKKVDGQWVFWNLSLGAAPPL